MLTHCGWGGTLECLQHGKPVITFPGFGDQQVNSELLVSRGCGLSLDPRAFSAADVTRVTNKLLDDHASFATRVAAIQVNSPPQPRLVLPLHVAAVVFVNTLTLSSPLQASLLATGGGPLAVREIEGVVRHGVRHLIDEGYRESAVGRVGAGVRAFVWLALAVLPRTAALFLRCAVRLRQAAAR